MMTATDRPHWSYSSISQYLKCPLQYYFERIVRLPRTVASDAQVLGASVHSALAGYHRQLLAREPLLARHVQDAFLTAWDQQTSRARVIHLGGTSSNDDLALGVALIEAYLREPPPQDIVAVERPILAPVADSRGDYLERPILVVPDLITRQDDASLKITEIKTLGRSFSASEVATSLQPTFYANALYEQTGAEPAVEFTVLVKTRSPKVQRIEAFRAGPDFQRLGDIIGVVARAIEAGVFYPQESPLNCSSCSFFRECRGWTGPGSSSSGELQVLQIEEGTPCSRR